MPKKKVEISGPVKTSAASSVPNPNPSPAAAVAPLFPEEVLAPKEGDPSSLIQDPICHPQLGNNMEGNSLPTSQIQTFEEELSEDEEGEICLQPSPSKKKGKQGRKTDKERREEDISPKGLPKPQKLSNEDRLLELQRIRKFP